MCKIQYLPPPCEVGARLSTGEVIFFVQKKGKRAAQGVESGAGVGQQGGQGDRYKVLRPGLPGPDESYIYICIYMYMYVCVIVHICTQT